MRAAVPLAVAIAAVVAGGLALALPGLALLGLFSLTAASDEPGLPAPLLDSARVVARNWRRVAIALVAIAVADFAIVFLCQRFAIVSPQKKAITPDDLAQVARVGRLAALGFALLSPLAASALAAISDQRQPSGSLRQLRQRRQQKRHRLHRERRPRSRRSRPRDRRTARDPSTSSR